jgi:hypothetical protein
MSRRTTIRAAVSQPIERLREVLSKVRDRSFRSKPIGSAGDRVIGRSVKLRSPDVPISR